MYLDAPLPGESRRAQVEARQDDEGSGFMEAMSQLAEVGGAS